MRSVVRSKPRSRFYGPYKHGNRWRIIEVNMRTRKRRRFVFETVDDAMQAILASKLSGELAAPPTLGKPLGTTRSSRRAS